MNIKCLGTDDVFELIVFLQLWRQAFLLVIISCHKETTRKVNNLNSMSHLNRKLIMKYEPFPLIRSVKKKIADM
jgi:hypothetical protein